MTQDICWTEQGGRPRSQLGRALSVTRGNVHHKIDAKPQPDITLTSESCRSHKMEISGDEILDFYYAPYNQNLRSKKFKRTKYFHIQHLIFG